MSCFNFIIMKVNGADVSNLPYDEAVQLFLNAEEPILVEVRRRFFDETNKLSFFNQDTNKSPTLAVIASSNTPNLYEGVDFCRLTGETSTTSNLRTQNLLNEKPAISSISCQTDLSAFDSESKEIIFMKDDPESNSGIFFQRKQPDHDSCLRTEFDIAEITLTKSQSAENLGFTISYSTEDYSESDSGSDECVGECKGSDRRESAEYSSNVNRCKIYVSDIMPNSLADRDGRLHQGDRILQINGQNVLEKVDPNKLLTENKYSVTILVSRYAYAGDDDFLDSAVYCDDKECQDDRHQSSSICECEQNTFSSKSSISQSEQKSCTPTTVTNIYPILPIAVEKVSDLFNHANIKAQLESVNKEISLLNSQISIMKLQQLQSENQVLSLDKQDKQEKPIQMGVGTRPDIEIEHIYETIPEDTESDAYYCSPYEGGASDKLRVEQWLKSLGCTKTQGERNRTDNTVGVGPRLQKHNPSLDDYDNSSSAYNTGGSCNSALLPLDQQKSKSTLVRHNSRKFPPTKCKNHQGLSLNKTALIASGKQEHRAYSSQKLSTCVVNRQNVEQPSTSVPISSHYPTDVDSDGHSTLVAARSSVYRMFPFKAIEEDYKDEELSEMVWKVKRRPDGSRYIVRRVIKKSHPTDKSPDDGGFNPPDTVAAIDHKRQVQKLKDRHHRHKHTTTPSKEKHHAQHWLV